MTKRRVPFCQCGHPIEWHGPDADGNKGKGPCTHGKGTAFGGCDCKGAHRTRQVETPADLLAPVRAAFDALRDAVCLALASGQPAMQVLHVPPLPALPGCKTAPVVMPPLPPIPPLPKAVAAALPRPPRAPDGLGPGERRVLTALVQRWPDGATRTWITIQTGLRRRRRDACIEALVGMGDAQLVDGGVCATQAGVNRLGRYEALPVGAALIAHWRAHLPAPEAQVFDAIVTYGQHGLARTEITRLTGHKRRRRDAILAQLRSRLLIQALPGSVVKLAPDLAVPA